MTVYKNDVLEITPISSPSNYPSSNVLSFKYHHHNIEAPRVGLIDSVGQVLAATIYLEPPRNSGYVDFSTFHLKTFEGI